MDWTSKDQKYVWHPFTQVQTEGRPIPIERGEGVYLFASDGKKYMDVNSSWWVNLHGHSHPELVDALKTQLDELQHVIFAGITHKPASELAEKIANICPSGLDKVFFSDNGSTSIEVAIKIAFQYWHNKGEERRKVIAIEGAYHGDTFGSMSVSERDVFNRPFEPFMFDVEYIEFPNGENDDEVIASFRNLVEQGNVASFVFEPLVQGAAGMRMYSEATLDELLSIAQQHKVICIADEVMTGFGRTGTTLAIDQIKANPDIICLSKGLTGGYLPMGLSVVSQYLFDEFLHVEKRKGFLHGHSFTGNPLACAVAIASLDLLQEDSTQEAIKRITTSHEVFALKYKEAFQHSIRVKGTILAIDLKINNEATGYFNPATRQAYSYFIKKGLIIRPLGNSVFVNPPYCITSSELDYIYGTLWEFSEKF